MRAQRSFIVEFKPGRRQPKSQKASIWGNTDLKALAREVEDQAPHIFRREQSAAANEKVSAAIGDTSRNAPTQSVDNEAVITTPRREDAISKPSAMETSEPQVLTTHTEAEAKGPIEVPSIATVRRRRSVFSEQTHQDRPPTQVHAADHSSPISSHELAELEEENRRLKALLRSHLQTENAHLKKMLARFS
jgi:hypothetical protein